MTKPWPSVRLGAVVTPAQLAADILKKVQRIAEIMGNIQKLLGKVGS